MTSLVRDLSSSQKHCAEPKYESALETDKTAIKKMLKFLQHMYEEHRQCGDLIGTEAEFTSYNILIQAMVLHI